MLTRFMLCRLSFEIWVSVLRGNSLLKQCMTVLFSDYTVGKNELEQGISWIETLIYQTNAK